MLRFIQYLFSRLFSLFAGKKQRTLGSDANIPSEELMGFKTLTLTTDAASHVAVVKLNRPRKKNAINATMYEEIQRALLEIAENQNVLVCLLTGEGNFYCAGNDLSNFSSVGHPLTLAKTASKICSQFVGSFIKFPKPLIVAVNGPAIGIAVTTLGLCDYVVASEAAYFKTPFAALGQAPEGCSSFTFPKIMGEELAHKVLWEGLVLKADDALACGLVDAVFPEDSLLDCALEYANSLAASIAFNRENGNSAGIFVKKILRDEGMFEKLLEVNREECAVLEKKFVSKECFVALATFLESRNMKMAAMVLRIANFTGFLWGQP